MTGVLRTSLPTNEERIEAGRALRRQVKRGELGRWRPAEDRPDPLDLIEEAHEGRLQRLVPVRVGRMMASPYAFLRGSAALMAEDFAPLPRTGVEPVICGDAHLGNFGFYASPERDLVFDLNDFDEAHPGPWEWDLRRLTTSVWVAGRQNGLSEDTCEDAVLRCAYAYRRQLRQLAGQPGQRNLFLLSDGRHEGTPTTLGQAIAAAKKAKVKVFTVGLEVPGRPQDQAALAKLAEGTGGDTVPTKVENLEALLGALGRNLASQYVVDLPLPPGLGSEVDFRLTVQASGGVGEYHNDRFFIPQQAGPATAPLPAELPRAPALSRMESSQGRYIVALCGFAAILLVLLLLFGPGSRSSRPYRALRQRLSPYSLTSAIADERTRPTAFGSSEWAGRATAMAETLVQRGNLEEAFLDRLEAAGLNMRVAEFVLISLGSAFIPPLLVLILTRNLLVSMVVVLLGTVGPFLWLAVLASRRQAKFDEQLPSTLQLLSGALQAGHSLQQAVDTVVQEAGDPIAGEFHRVLTEARLGRPLEEAFEAMAKRTRSLDFEWTVMAIRLQRQVGGNLAEVLSTVSQTIRDRYSLKRQIRALSAEGRLSSLILSILPLLLFAALLVFNPLFLRPLFTTKLGIMMMAGSIVLMIFGVFWLKKITEIKV